MDNFIEGKGFLINPKINLKDDVEYKVNINLEEINRGDIITVFVKISGESIKSPHEIPYNDYYLELEHKDLKYYFSYLNLTSLKEVFPYSFAMTFSCSNVETLKTDINSINAFLPNFIIGYDDMSFIDGNIINNTTFELNFKENIYKVQIKGNSEFNNTFSNFKAQTSFTSSLSITAQNNSLINSDLFLEILEDLNNLISFAYGSQRPWIEVEGMIDNKLVFNSFRDTYYKDCSVNYPIIPIKYSGNLSNFIIQVFNIYNSLSYNEKNKLSKLFKLICNTKSKISFPNSIDDFENCINFFNSNFEFIETKSPTSINDILFELNKIEIYCLKKIGYLGKYFDYNRNNYIIRELV